MAKITPVIMSGGSGTRLWPASRAANPKQFHKLGGDHTLIQDTALRSAGDLFEAPVVVCNAAHAAIVRDQLADVGTPAQMIVLEPAARNTAPCCVAAAALLAAKDPDALLLLLPADHVITDVAAYRDAVDRGKAAAEAGALVVFGLKPDRPETGYGYIKASGVGEVRHVEAFVEKPDAATANAYVADPAYSWNAGMFLFSAKAFLEEARRLAPEVAEISEAAAKDAHVDGDLVTLADSFKTAPNISIDYAVMEKTDKARVVPCDLGWSDVGAWRALWEQSERAPAHNALLGDVTAIDTTGCLVRTDGPQVALVGVQDLVVVVDKGVILVARRDDSAGVKAMVEKLKADGRTELL